MDTFFSLLADDVVWEINGSPEIISSHGAYYGKEAVQDWVADLSAEVEFMEFGTDQFFADGDTVIVLFHDSGMVRATGKMIDQREVAVVTFEDGMIANFLCFDDSAQELLAHTPDE
jgi:ketosteroid isomerase-like protein